MGGGGGKIVGAVVGIAAVAIGAIVAGPVGGGAALAAAFGATSAASIAVATSVVTAVVASAVSMAAGALLPKPSAPTFTQTLRDRTVMVRQPITSRRIVYGQNRVSGPIVFTESYGNDNKVLHLVLALASHEVEDIDKVFFNDIEVWDKNSGVVSKYSGILEINVRKGGSDNNSWPSSLINETEWSTAHKLSGIAAVHLRMTFDQDKFPTGIPNVTARVKGKKIFDPRTSTTSFSANSALCIRDYLLDQEYGLGCDASEVNDTDFIAAANICDEDVNLASGGTENRYEMHGMISLDSSPEDILNVMMTSCAGKLVYTGGKFSIFVGAYRTPTITLDEDDLAGAITVQTRRSRRDQYNAVRGVFNSAADNYIVTDFPAITSSTFEAEDNGERIFKDLELPFTTSASMAQRLAKISLFESRQQIFASVVTNLTSMRLRPGDTIYLNNTRFGWSNKIFEVETFKFEADNSGNLVCSMTLKETASSIYDWSSSEEKIIEPLDPTNLPDPTDVSAPGLSVIDELQAFNQEAITTLVATVSSGEPFQQTFEVQAKKSTETEYTNMGRAAGNKFTLINVEDRAIYDVRARVVNTLGVRSEYTTITHEVVGKTAPPSDVTNFSINSVGGSAVLTWEPVTDLDLSHYKIRYHKSTTSPIYSDSLDIVPKVSRPGNSAIVPAKTGTYFIKAVDKLGIESINATSVSLQTTIGDVESLNLITSLQQDPDFDGNKTNVVKVSDDTFGSVLKLDTSIQFDSASGNFDDANGLFDAGNGNIQSSGEYEFDNYIDLGEKYSSRITSDIDFIREDSALLFDDPAGLFDSVSGLFDGDPNNYDDVNVKLQVSTTDDDPAGTPTWSAYRDFFVGDYTARALRFKALLTTQSATSTPRVNGLDVSVDMPDRVEAQNDISFTGQTSITFPTGFKETPAIGVAVENLATGDYYAITGKSRTGFTITVYDSTDTQKSTSTSFDYVAKGYGREVA